VTELVVLDLETTGMGPCPPERALEVAVVRLAPDATPLGEWETLLQPERPVEASWLHGITDAMLLGAPRFAEIAGELAGWLQDAIVVGHNPAFDLGFLRGELALCGRELPRLPLLCTRELTRRLYPDLDSYRLGSCCAWFGIRRARAHAAIDDAHATAALLRALLLVARLRGLHGLEALGGEPGEPLRASWWDGSGPAWPRRAQALPRWAVQPRGQEPAAPAPHPAPAYTAATAGTPTAPPPDGSLSPAGW
jgi:DNA polymerase III epsilon subunit family exonuclease